MLAAMVAASAGSSLAQVRPNPGPGDRHIQTVEYRADQVVRLEAAPGYELTVSLSPDEQVETVAVGDSAAWQVTTNHGGDHLFIKLAQGSGDTNMTVATNVRQYVFELTALTSPTEDMAYTVQFQYPPPASAAFTPTTPTGVVGRYRVTGARAIRPSLISDDGNRTYIEWPKQAALPAVYILDGKGREALVNGVMRDDRMIISAISPVLVFRIDRQVAYATRLKTVSR